MKKQPIDVVSDNAHDLAHDLKTDLTNLGADARKVAEQYIAPRARDLADYIGPRAKEVADNVADYVQPRAQDLGRRGVRFAEETRDSVAPRVAHFVSDTRETVTPKLVHLAEDARDTVTPKLVHLAEETRDTVAPYLADARHRLQPKLEDAAARVQPFVDAGVDRFNADLRPRIEEAIENVNALPQTQEAKERLLAARAALAGELSFPDVAELVESKPKRSVGKTILLLVLAGGLLAGVVYAIKRFFAPEDSGWQAHEPSEACRREDAPAATFAGATAAGATAAQAVADEARHAASEEGTEDAPAARRAATAEAPEGGDPFAVSPYGEGSYVGTEPGPEFVIKGNERSMKYHVQGSGGFERTIADVWFNSEEAAQAAGFTKAQR